MTRSKTSAELVDQAVAEAGTDTEPRMFSAERVSQAITAQAGGGGAAIAADGSFNVYQDSTALANISSGSNNIAIGQIAGGRVTTGSLNIALGVQAMGGTGSGSAAMWNVAIGYQAMFNASLSSADDNVVIGHLAGNKITTGNNNLILGANAGPTTNQSSKLFIGDTESDTPLIYGDFVAETIGMEGALDVSGEISSTTLDISGKGTFTVAGSNEVAKFVCSDNSTPYITMSTDSVDRFRISSSSAETSLKTQTALSLVLGTNATTAVTIDSSQDTTFVGSVIVDETITLNGGQLKFPATQAASADANTLDDYEEGTWTPSVTGTETSSGRYTRIGDVVTVTGYITAMSDITTTTPINIGGLPFTNGTTTGVCAILVEFIALDSGYTQFVGYVYPSNTIVRVYMQGSDKIQVAVTHSDMTSATTSSIRFSATYSLS